ncbi:MAG: hypothetical protein AAFX46_13075 [Cyanobacteria bacterium J06636_27]
MDRLKSLLFWLLFICAILTPIIVEYLRHRSYLKHRHMDITPGTQHIALWGSFLQMCFLICIVLVIKFL